MPYGDIVKLDPALLDILACPSDDHAPLRVGTAEDPQAEVLECTYCKTRYPVRDDIPVLLLDEAEPGPNGIGVAAGDQS